MAFLFHECNKEKSDTITEHDKVDRNEQEARCADKAVGTPPSSDASVETTSLSYYMVVETSDGTVVAKHPIALNVGLLLRNILTHPDAVQNAHHQPQSFIISSTTKKDEKSLRKCKAPNKKVGPCNNSQNKRFRVGASHTKAPPGTHTTQRTCLQAKSVVPEAKNQKSNFAVTVNTPTTENVVNVFCPDTESSENDFICAVEQQMPLNESNFILCDNCPNSPVRISIPEYTNSNSATLNVQSNNAKEIICNSDSVVVDKAAAIQNVPSCSLKSHIQSLPKKGLINGTENADFQVSTRVFNNELKLQTTEELPSDEISIEEESVLSIYRQSSSCPKNKGTVHFKGHSKDRKYPRRIECHNLSKVVGCSNSEDLAKNVFITKSSSTLLLASVSSSDNSCHTSSCASFAKGAQRTNYNYLEEDHYLYDINADGDIGLYA